MRFAPSLAGSAVRRLRWRDVISEDFTRFGALTLISLLAGLLINLGRSQPLPLVYLSKTARLHEVVARLGTGALPTLPPAAGQGPREIELDEFQDFALAKKGLVIDARSSFFYRAGHVPGAINVSREGFDAEYRGSKARLEAHRTDAVAVYCSGPDCEDSALVAEALRTLGYRRLLVYREGWEQWSQSGLPQEK